MEIYYVGDEVANSKKYKSLREQNFKLWKEIQTEDINIILPHLFFIISFMAL